ncbi:MAG TPA: TIGR03032 family protein [Cyclobacteriaceae bacterium]|nr:TIGR03032 family protein [Cyclobacteriaceae bacterium]
MSAPLPPFSCTFSPTAPEILHGLGATLAISTYQAGKVIFISAQDKDHLVQLPRNFEKPMGIALQGDKLAIATTNSVLVLKNANRMAPNYPKQKNTYDALYLPRAQYFTGENDIHDLHWAGDELWAVNTRFSCLATIDEEFSFHTRWKPFFIHNTTPTDQCHLNGVAFENDKPKYVTALGQSDQPGGWRERKADGGILMDVESNEIIATNLLMPHSPRIIDGQLYWLHSATGDLVRMTSPGKYEVLKSLDGFVRGMDRMGDYLFIGLSKLRETSQAFQNLPVSKKSIYSGIVILYIPKMSLAGFIKYENNVDEIYDVRIIPGVKRPGLLNSDMHHQVMAITTNENDYWGVVEKKSS